MNSRERVMRAIEFQGPDRVPVCFDIIGSDYFSSTYGNDIITIGFDQVKQPVGDKSWMDEFGCIWQSITSTVGEVKRPAIDGWESLEHLSIPDFGDDSRYEGVREMVKKNPDKFIVGSLGFLMFENMHHVRGLVDLLCDFYLEPQNVAKLMEMLIDHNLSIVDAYSQCGVHALIGFDDWGLQDRLIISPELWREWFKPAYKTIIDRVHDKEMKFIMHSCGYIIDILPDLIEIGVDVMQLDQQNNMGLEKLIPACSGKICMYCPLDIQATPQSSPMELEKGVQRLFDAFHRNGGFIGKLYSQPFDIGITNGMMHTLCNAFIGLGDPK